jgi:uncharacterized protein (TIGR02145 family)
LRLTIASGKPMKNATIVILLLIAAIACKKDYYGPKPDDWEPPYARLNGNESLLIGDTTTWFTFIGVGSRDCEGLWGIISFRWDLNGDGIWDTPFTRNEEWVHVFPQPGTYLVIMQVADRYGITSSDSITVITYGANWDLSTLTDPRDGQVYKTVRIDSIQWMAENLNYGIMIPVTDTAMDNGIVEKYCFNDYPERREDEGGYYTYYDFLEIMDYDTTTINGICPPGWELPTSEDWLSILTKYPFNYYTVGGLSNLNLTGTGFQPRCQSWETGGLRPGKEKFTYFTRDFYKGYLNGPNKIIPYIITSNVIRTRGMNYPLQYYNDSIRKYMGIAPVRCIKRDN